MNGNNKFYNYVVSVAFILSLMCLGSVIQFSFCRCLVHCCHVLHFQSCHFVLTCPVQFILNASYFLHRDMVLYRKSVQLWVLFEVYFNVHILSKSSLSKI